MKDLGNYKREDSIPDINVEIDPFNGGGHQTKYVTTSDGKKARVNVRFTGDLFKELYKHKFIINKNDTISYKNSHSSASESKKMLFGIVETYTQSLPLSERIYMWLKTNRNRNRFVNMLFTKYLKYQQKHHFFETHAVSEEYEQIKALGGHVMLGVDKDGNKLFIPIEKEGDGFKIPDGYRVEVVYDGINIPGFNKPKEKKKEAPKEDVKKESTTEKKPASDNIVDDFRKLDDLFIKAKETNKGKHTGSTKEMHPEHFGELDIINGATRITTNIDKLPDAWEYPTKEMIIVREPTIELSDVISPTIEIVDYNNPSQAKHTTTDTNDLNNESSTSK